MVYNQSAFQISLSIAFDTAKIQTEVKKRA